MMFYSQKICIDPQDPTPEHLVRRHGFQCREDHGQNNYGVFMTTDRGVHWTQIFAGNMPNGTIGIGC